MYHEDSAGNGWYRVVTGKRYSDFSMMPPQRQRDRGAAQQNGKNNKRARQESRGA
jgi:hypothetical protein